MPHAMAITTRTNPSRSARRGSIGSRGRHGGARSIRIPNAMAVTTRMNPSRSARSARSARRGSGADGTGPCVHTHTERHGDHHAYGSLTDGTGPRGPYAYRTPWRSQCVWIARGRRGGARALTARGHASIRMPNAMAITTRMDRPRCDSAASSSTSPRHRRRGPQPPAARSPSARNPYAADAAVRSQPVRESAEIQRQANAADPRNLRRLHGHRPTTDVARRRPQVDPLRSSFRNMRIVSDLLLGRCVAHCYQCCLSAALVVRMTLALPPHGRVGSSAMGGQGGRRT